MKNKGFTLIETLLSVFLIGVITLGILPIFNNSIERTKKEKIKKELMYLSEMTIEHIKSYKIDQIKESNIHGMSLKEIIESFKEQDQVVISFLKINDVYNIDIVKENKSENLWCLYSKAYYINEGDDFYVEYKAYIPKP